MVRFTTHTVEQVCPFLYIASYNAINEEKMVEMGVTHLIDANNIPGKKKLPGIEYMDIEVEDTEFSNISSYFDEAVRFINDAREKGGKVIVYCCAGISRSAAICMMYLVMQEGLTLRKAYYEVERARLGIQPNQGFWR